MTEVLQVVRTSSQFLVRGVSSNSLCASMPRNATVCTVRLSSIGREQMHKFIIARSPESGLTDAHAAWSRHVCAYNFIQGVWSRISRPDTLVAKYRLRLLSWCMYRLRHSNN